MKLGYVRVSSTSQSVERQLEGLKDLQLEHIYIDRISGAMKERPELNLCLHAIRRGDHLYIYSIDRLARSLRDLQEIVAQVVAKGVTIEFICERLTFDASDNPMSMLTLQLLGAFAQFERSISKKRQREGLDAVKIHGTKTGRPIGRPTLDYNLSNKVKSDYVEGLRICDLCTKYSLSRPSIYKLLKS